MTGPAPRPEGHLPPAAVTALLTLRLRSALQEAEAAEAEEAAFVTEQPADATRSDEVLQQRRTELANEFEHARELASRRIEAAEQEAHRIRSEARARAEELVLRRQAPAPPEFTAPAHEATPKEIVAFAADPTGPDPWVEFAAPGAAAPSEVAMAVEAAVAQSIVAERWADVPATRSADNSPAVVTVDAEAFARVFATVLATVLDERFAAWRSGMTGPLPTQAIVAVPQARKPSLLRRMFHLDTVLAVLAAAIALVLLFAWLG